MSISVSIHALIISDISQIGDKWHKFDTVQKNDDSLTPKNDSMLHGDGVASSLLVTNYDLFTIKNVLAMASMSTCSTNEIA